MGADGRGNTPGIGAETTIKVVLLKHRLIVCALGKEKADNPFNGHVYYDFHSWIDDIEQKARQDVTVAQLSTIIRDSIPGAFKFLSDAIKRGQITQRDFEYPDADLAEYFIAGYENGRPVVHVVYFRPDWVGKGLTVPKDKVIYPNDETYSKPLWSKPYIRVFGMNAGLYEIKVPGSKERRELESRVPIEVGMIDKGDSFSLKQASNTIRSLLAIEMETDSHDVGFPVTVITVPRLGMPHVSTFLKDAYPLSKLPRAIATKPKPLN